MNRVSENGRGKETHPNQEKSRNGCRRSARTQRRGGFSSPGSEKQYSKEKPQTRSSVGGCRSVKGSEKSVEGSRRSGRRDRGGNVGKSDEVVIEKRVTRSSVRGNKVVVYEISDSDSDDDSDESVVSFSKERKEKGGVDNEKNVGEIEKRVTRRSGKICTKKASNVSNTSRRKAVVSDEVEPKGDDELSKVDTSKKDIKDCGVVRRNGEQNCGRKGQIGEKRKRDGVEEECETARGWSKEQEAALQRAYFTTKPTPQFWKKVSRMFYFSLMCVTASSAVGSCFHPTGNIERLVALFAACVSFICFYLTAPWKKSKRLCLLMLGACFGWAAATPWFSWLFGVDTGSQSLMHAAWKMETI